MARLLRHPWRIFGVILTGWVAYSLLIYATLPPREVWLSEPAHTGKILFQKYNCIACHQLYGLGGYMGPDLTNVIRRRGPDYTRIVIMHGTATMPNLGVTEAEARAIVDFLRHVDSSGTYPIQSVAPTWYGTVKPILP